MNSKNQYFPMHSLLENALDKVLTVRLSISVLQHDRGSISEKDIKRRMLYNMVDKMSETLPITKQYNPSFTPDPHGADYQYQVQAVVLTVDEYKQLLSLAGYNASNKLWEGLK